MPSYSKAPIIEAVIDIGVASPTPMSILDLSDAFKSLKDKYPERELVRANELGFSGGDDGSLALAVGAMEEGLRYSSPDGSMVLNNTPYQRESTHLQAESCCKLNYQYTHYLDHMHCSHHRRNHVNM